jgi:hypothetical protein
VSGPIERARERLSDRIETAAESELAICASGIGCSGR